jgi:hypothetical protein
MPIDFGTLFNSAAIFLRVETVYLFYANVFLLLGRYVQHVFFHVDIYKFSFIYLELHR